METTSNFGLKKPAQSDTVAAAWQAMNDNMDAIDALPVPVASGKNSQLRYQKYADGILHVWGCVDHGTSYPCSNQVASATGYMSSSFTLNFPAAFADTSYTCSTSVQANAYWDTSVFVASRSAGSIKLAYACPLNDASANNSKVLSIDLWGRWQ